MLIYCIEDINDLKYVGSTKEILSTRLSKHRTDYRKEYYDKNKDEIKTRMKEYYQQHKEERKAYNNKYYYDKKN